jgi:H+-transporting ATPase
VSAAALPPLSALTGQVKYSVAEADTYYGKRLRVVKGGTGAVLAMVPPQGSSEIVERLTATQEGLACSAGCHRAVAVIVSEDGGPLRYAGILPITDPPRDSTAASSEALKRLGIRTRMLTGDHHEVAKGLARKVIQILMQSGLPLVARKVIQILIQSGLP